jgi:tRNA (guanine37-N1)-methyltransferase
MSNLKKALRKELTKDELNLLPTSFDVIGSIIVFSDFPKQLIKKEKIIGEAVLRNFRHVKSVFKKTRKFSGEYRTPKLKLLAGLRTKETEHKENNTSIRLNAEKVYFSPRLSSERKRIFEQVRAGEDVMVMFSGAAVYPISIAKNSRARNIVAIEANPTAHKYACDNVILNKVDNVKLIMGDVRKEAPKLRKKFDRIVMPLPKGSEDFLVFALKAAKRGAIIHLYQFLNEDEFDDFSIRLEKICKEHKKKCKIIRFVKCGQFSPRVYRVCVDIKIT